MTIDKPALPLVMQCRTCRCYVAQLITVASSCPMCRKHNLKPVSHATLSYLLNTYQGFCTACGLLRANYDTRSNRCHKCHLSTMQPITRLAS